MKIIIWRKSAGAEVIIEKPERQDLQAVKSDLQNCIQ